MPPAPLVLFVTAGRDASGATTRSIASTTSRGWATPAVRSTSTDAAAPGSDSPPAAWPSTTTGRAPPIRRSRWPCRRDACSRFWKIAPATSGWKRRLPSAASRTGDSRPMTQRNGPFTNLSAALVAGRRGISVGRSELGRGPRPFPSGRDGSSRRRSVITRCSTGCMTPPTDCREKSRGSRVARSRACGRTAASGSSRGYAIVISIRAACRRTSPRSLRASTPSRWTAGRFASAQNPRLPAGPAEPRDRLDCEQPERGLQAALPLSPRGLRRGVGQRRCGTRVAYAACRPAATVSRSARPTTASGPTVKTGPFRSRALLFLGVVHHAVRRWHLGARRVGVVAAGPRDQAALRVGVQRTRARQPRDPRHAAPEPGGDRRRARGCPASARAARDGIRPPTLHRFIGRPRIRSRKRGIWSSRCGGPSCRKRLGWSTPCATSPTTRASPGTNVSLAIDGVARRCCADVELQLLRVCQEAVNNAIAHGCRRHPDRRRVRAAEVALRVSDNGCGFVVDSDAETDRRGASRPARHGGARGAHRRPVVDPDTPGTGTVVEG